MCGCLISLFFFKQKTAYEMRISDWSSDVCSSDLSLCNEVLGGMTLQAQCALAASLGYDGLEIAPFTLAEDPLALDAAAIREIRKTVEDAGLAVRSEERRVGKEWVSKSRSRW